MTDYMKHRLADLRARQEAEEHMLCPRCGADTMKHPVHTNAMSRVADIFICDACGTTEALLAHMNQQTPLTNWAAFKPTGLPSDFKARLARDVLEDVVRNQTETLTRIFRLCQDDPKNAAEYRLEAFESCPGLTELWTEPFAAKYQALDGSAVVRLTMSGDGHPLLEAGLADK